MYWWLSVGPDDRCRSPPPVRSTCRGARRSRGRGCRPSRPCHRRSRSAGPRARSRAAGRCRAGIPSPRGRRSASSCAESRPARLPGRPLRARRGVGSRDEDDECADRRRRRPGRARHRRSRTAIGSRRMRARSAAPPRASARAWWSGSGPSAPRSGWGARSCRTLRPDVDAGVSDPSPAGAACRRERARDASPCPSRRTRPAATTSSSPRSNSGICRPTESSRLEQLVAHDLELAARARRRSRSIAGPVRLARGCAPSRSAWPRIWAATRRAWTDRRARPRSGSASNGPPPPVRFMICSPIRSKRSQHLLARLLLASAPSRGVTWNGCGPIAAPPTMRRRARGHAHRRRRRRRSSSRRRTTRSAAIAPRVQHDVREHLVLEREHPVFLLDHPVVTAASSPRFLIVRRVDSEPFT